MATYTNTTKPSAGSNTNTTKPAASVTRFQPFGLLLALTKLVGTNIYTFGSIPSAGSYTNETKPT